MTKKQKIWLAIFASMFIIPEILWMPISNFYYQLLQTNQSGGTHPISQNFLTNSDNLEILCVVVCGQFISLILMSIFVLIAKIKNKIAKIITIIFLFLLLLLVGFAAIFLLNFNPMIG